MSVRTGGFRMRKIGFLVALLCVGLFSTAQAHLQVIGSDTTPIEFTGYGISAQETGTHDDESDPFKGSLMIYAMNTGSFAWTDFHIKITDPYSKGIENVFIVDGFDTDFGNIDPTSSQSGLTWNITAPTATEGAMIDLYFTDTVEYGELAWFKIYTNNTIDKADFGVCFYPTVPEPATLAMFGLGTLVLLRKKR